MAAVVQAAAPQTAPAKKQTVALLDRVTRMISLGLAVAVAVFVLGSFVHKASAVVGLGGALQSLLAAPAAKLALAAPSSAGPVSLFTSAPLSLAPTDVLFLAVRSTVLLPVQLLTVMVSSTAGVEAGARYAFPMEVGFVLGAGLAYLGDM